jgi:dephospho-CoA kinase
MIVGITGNIGAGKSAAANIFWKQGYKKIDADKIGHELYKRNDIKQKIVKKFTREVLTDGEIDRKKLKKVVFYDSRELKRLNKIMHPAIVKEIKERIKDVRNVVVDGALLIEAKFKDYDKLLLVTIDFDKEIERLLAKGKYTRNEIQNIMNSQMGQDKKLKYADYVVDNSGSIKEFERNIRKIIKKIT